MTDRKCLDCGAPVTGHSGATRCRTCASQKAYFDKHGQPAVKVILKCEVCGCEKVDYASNHRKSVHDVFFCSSACRAAWTGVHNSVARGGDGMKRTKAEKDALYYREHADQRRARSTEYYRANANNVVEKCKAKDRAMKLEIIAAYGGECECCGEKAFEFLTIDHVNGDGAEHRRQIGGKGRRLYAAIKAEGFPRDRYRLLCFNCNIALGFYGYCPHRPELRSNVSHAPFNPGRKRKVA